MWTSAQKSTTDTISSIPLFIYLLELFPRIIQGAELNPAIVQEVIERVYRLNLVVELEAAVENVLFGVEVLAFTRAHAASLSIRVTMASFEIKDASFLHGNLGILGILGTLPIYKPLSIYRGSSSLEGCQVS
jgi:hypothetical protein